MATARDRWPDPPGDSDRVQRAAHGDTAVLAGGGPGRLVPTTAVDDRARQVLVRCGFALEWATLGWNVAGIIFLAIAAIAARSVALAGFGLDSLIKIGASTVVIWELSGTGAERQRRALRLIGSAFAALASAGLRTIRRRPGPLPSLLTS